MFLRSRREKIDQKVLSLETIDLLMCFGFGVLFDIVVSTTTHSPAALPPPVTVVKGWCTRRNLKLLQGVTP